MYKQEFTKVTLMVNLINNSADRDASTSTRSNSYKRTTSMPIYLYVKTHNKTGLKYLGKTISNDPYSYQGSGTVWKRHIKKHGYDVTTEILLQTTDPKELKEVGIYYSNLWNIVESKDFANIVPEMGDGGAQLWTAESRQKLSKANKGRKHTEEAKNNYSRAQQKQAQHLSKKLKEYLSIPENYQKRYNQLTSNWNNPEHRENMSKKMSSLKWCNDGVRNYRKSTIPDGMVAGKLHQHGSHIINKLNG
jgi:hypothetical protein